MIICYLRLASLTLALCACTNTAAPAPGAPADKASPSTPTPAAHPTQSALAAADGSLDLHFSALTVDVNSGGDTSSTQCQLQFTATNRSQAPVKSLIAAFNFTRASDGSAITTESSLAMPFEIPPGESKDAWGAITIDSQRCDDLQIALQAPTAGMCRTKDASPCPAYRLSGDGVASVK